MLALIFAAALAGHGDVAGKWMTPSKHGVVEISHCGASICGRLVTSDNIAANPGLKDTRNKDAGLRGRTLKGLMLLDGFSGGPTEWTGGRIYNPEDGGTYHANVTLTGPNELKLQGCIVAPFCKTQVWKRAP
jgi:uncharacterized protein (DUF2147 family)